MAFSVDDVRDLLRVLDEHPDWKREVRRAILTEEILGLPALVRDLAEAQRRTEARLEALTARVDDLAEAQRRTEARLEALTARVDDLAEAQRRTEARLEALAEAQRRTEETVRQLVIDVARLNGSDLERRFRENAPAYLSGRYRRGRVLSKQELVDALDDALDSGLLNEAEAEAMRREIRAADAVIRARDAEGEVWLVVEVSLVVDRDDVARAVRRAEALGKLGMRTRAGVAGLRFTEGAERLLANDGIERWTLDDG